MIGFAAVAFATSKSHCRFLSRSDKQKGRPPAKGGLPFHFDAAQRGS